MQIIDLNKNLILDAASKLFLQYGIRSVSMDDLASQLGMSKKTLYLHFKDKDEIVQEVVESYINKSECQCSQDADKSLDAIHESLQLIDFAEGMMKTMRSSILFELFKYHKKAFNLIERHKKEFVPEVIKSNLTRGISEGLYRPNINLDILTIFRTQAIFFPLENSAFEVVDNITYSEVQKELLIHFLYGIVSDTGRLKLQEYLNNHIK